MLSYYHPKNGGTMKQFDEIYFDRNTKWYKNDLVPSGIAYPGCFFYIAEIPDDPNGMYRLGGSCGGNVRLYGNDPYISSYNAK